MEDMWRQWLLLGRCFIHMLLSLCRAADSVSMWVAHKKSSILDLYDVRLVTGCHRRHYTAVFTPPDEHGELQVENLRHVPLKHNHNQIPHQMLLSPVDAHLSNVSETGYCLSEQMFPPPHPPPPPSPPFVSRLKPASCC